MADSGTKQSDDSMVICPNCVCQFRATPVDVQAQLAALKLELARRENYLVWAMSNMNMPEHHIGFSSHVLRRGGVGDLSDCITYIDAALARSKPRG